MQANDPPDTPSSVRIVSGFPEAARAEVARQFWSAFSTKLGPLMRPEERALAFIENALRPEFAYAALDGDDQVLGVVGIKTERGGLVSAGFREVVQSYGWVGALWRAPLLELLERPLAPGQLLLDGVFVAAHARGQGVGTALITHVIEEAGAMGCTEIRLDVVDTNPQAEALYRRIGFVPDGVEHLGPLGLLFGFRSSTRMIYRLDG